MSPTVRSTLNASRTSPGAFSNVPRRGAVALVTTVLAVVLLFSFKPADPTTLAGGLPSQAPVVSQPPAATEQPVAAAPQPTPTRRPTTNNNGSSSGNGTSGAGSNGGSSQTVNQPPAPDPTPTSPSDGNAVSGTFTGDAINTAYGTVQIALVVQNGQIVDVQELQLPSDRRLSAQISAQAGPMLRDEVLRAQSDKINGVSGASYTSYGFYLSLQSALQKM